MYLWRKYYSDCLLQEKNLKALTISSKFHLASEYCYKKKKKNKDFMQHMGYARYTIDKNMPLRQLNHQLGSQTNTTFSIFWLSFFRKRIISSILAIKRIF